MATRICRHDIKSTPYSKIMTVSTVRLASKRADFIGGAHRSFMWSDSSLALAVGWRVELGPEDLQLMITEDSQ